MTFKKKKVIMLPTKSEAPFFTEGKIVKCIKNWTPIGEKEVSINRLSLSVNPGVGVLKYYEAQHLYFISDAVPKEKDYIIYKNVYSQKEELDQIETIKGDNIILKNNKTVKPFYCYKIIATTDLDIAIKKDTIKISQGRFDNIYPTEKKVLPQPSKSFITKFIESYNKQKPILECLVEYDCDHSLMPNKVIDILKVNNNNEITIKPIKNSYTREEVENLILKAVDDCDGCTKQGKIFIKQNL